MKGFIQVLTRDLKIALRRWSELCNPLIFFLIVASLFPLAISPEASDLKEVGTGVLWISALLSSLLALDGLFRDDAEDGSMEQLILSPVPLTIVIAAKILAHWLITGLPLVVIAPVIALSYYMPFDALTTLVLALILATPTLSVLGAIGAALTVSLRRGGPIVGLLVLPLTGPVLIFGTLATDLAVQGESAAGPLYLLGALLALAVVLGPLATSAAVRVSLE
ncbi:MAG: heme exporter protein CcmB [Pseudomonadota bacterium]|nr:heme exporter protein CcmB [Pseudomonadota bacterium]